MLKTIKAELAARKGVSLGAKGGSIPGVIPAWICRAMPELMIFFLGSRIFFSTFDPFLAPSPLSNFVGICIKRNVLNIIANLDKVSDKKGGL